MVEVKRVCMVLVLLFSIRGEVVPVKLEEGRGEVFVDVCFAGYGEGFPYTHEKRWQE